MLNTPQITQSAAQLTAVIRLTVPRAEIRNLRGPGIGELKTAVAALGIALAGPRFNHHLSMDPDIFDFEISVPVASWVSPVGRVKAGKLPSKKVAADDLPGDHEGLADRDAGGTRPARTFGNTTSQDRNRAPTRRPGAPNSTGR